MIEDLIGEVKVEGVFDESEDKLDGAGISAELNEGLDVGDLAVLAVDYLLVDGVDVQLGGLDETSLSALAGGLASTFPETEEVILESAPKEGSLNRVPPEGLANLELGLESLGLPQSLHHDLGGLLGSLDVLTESAIVGEVIESEQPAHKVAAVAEMGLRRLGVGHGGEETESGSVEFGVLGASVNVEAVEPLIRLCGR